MRHPRMRSLHACSTMRCCAPPLDLGRREKARRRVIFIVSDGRENGLARQLQGRVESAADQQRERVRRGGRRCRHPGDRQAGEDSPAEAGQQQHPAEVRLGHRRRDLPGVHPEALESAYGSAMEEARSQYTLVYNTHATASTSYRKIEVRVSGYGPSLKVYARDGYYPAPQQQ